MSWDHSDHSVSMAVMGRLAGALPGPDTTSRAALLIAICAGVILVRMLLGHTELNRPDTEKLIPYLRAALDAVAKTPEPDPGCAFP